MTRDEIRARLLTLLGRLAPEADLAALDPRRDLREQLEIDSFAMLTLLVDLDKELGVSVPERDVGRLRTLEACVDYLAARLGAS